ncbi:hypothetical protein SERLA73DRAFT_181396 [Serpula lacrymans var. lacrymans S7.3]|uniref:Uncharacterized protein n=2 Tax=Serpula lacrymans var. lacrymans TaxID=341189 RepID=F8PY00_SERL3|nr:uncharacterized protein SERLADRAFT_467522 [Serpula lacrymans var. lacrymans S7.9]EGN98763.1 hypothetical protein SERLA73DRAFT_181396 [Serpula lacrymans var. lacrymans S7.3]EGO24358.1 hypothetical protein SERLADRAFT_467522 [Serpula lacrymans var. lacrymans S7.9]
MLYSPQYRGPADCLSRCSETVCLIVKTAMWFDVLASATLVRKPRFIDVFRDIFSDRAPATFDGVEVLEDPRLSMLPIMGCENHIVRALAEIADLAVWKMNERHKGSLSVPMLVQRGLEIEKTLDPRPRPRPPQYLHLSVDAELETRRHLTSEVFRASARVYLHSVLSGDFPGCPEIVDGVKDTVQCLQQVPEYTTTSRFVVRSVVFSICICGCLTDNTGYRAYFLKRLEEQQKESVGNCSTVMTLMREVWNKRASGQPVDWRQVMRESTVLLV